MHDIWQDISPMISDVIVELIKILVVVLLAGLGLLQFKVKSAIDTIKNKNQRETFHKIANEAFAFAETMFTNEASQDKLNRAYDYASAKLKNLGITLTPEEITAAIEKACLEYNTKKKVVIEDKAS
ncbi:phage holin [Paenibacillus urinalis]|uniref:phage holin n=1 Tax=Paenibacillus urinalis TaxID=521520 RepID=UPI001960FA61